MTFIWCNRVPLHYNCNVFLGVALNAPNPVPGPDHLSCQLGTNLGITRSNQRARRHGPPLCLTPRTRLFSQAGVRASRRQPVITEIVRCDDSGMLITQFFVLSFFFLVATPGGSSAHTHTVRKNKIRTSLTQKVNQCIWESVTKYMFFFLSPATLMSNC